MNEYNLMKMNIENQYRRKGNDNRRWIRKEREKNCLSDTNPFRV